jgi:CubicO group peptidase (beta-lactamase class C family)
MTNRPIRGVLGRHMHRIGVLFAGGVALAVASGCAGLDRSARSADASRERLQSLVAGSEGVPAAGVVVARIDRAGRERALAVGCARFAADGIACERALTLDDKMRVASVSKLFVAVGVLQLVDAGRLDLDSDVSVLLGFPLRNPAYPQSAITVRQLLSHTSTLRDGERYNIAPPGTLCDLLADAGRFEPAHAPGKHFHYSNINFGVLGALIERASGERFDLYMRRSVLAPAGIAAGYNWSGLASLPLSNVAVLYRRRAPDSEVWDPSGVWQAQVDSFAANVREPTVPDGYTLGSNPTLFSPQGGLRIAPIDVARLVRMLFAGNGQANKSVKLSDESRALLCKPVFSAGGSSVTGDDEGGSYSAFGTGAQPKSIAGHAWCGHFAEAYGLKGGALYDAKRGETLVYFVTGYGGEPPVGDKRYPGLDALEAAAFDTALAMQP